MKPQAVTDSQAVFGVDLGDLLPAYSSLPDEFKGFRSNEWVEIVERWFFKGINADDLKTKDGIDRKAAFRHLAAIMRSFEPKHEHKIAGVAWLMSQWFDMAKTEDA